MKIPQKRLHRQYNNNKSLPFLSLRFITKLLLQNGIPILLSSGRRWKKIFNRSITTGASGILRYNIFKLFI